MLDLISLMFIVLGVVLLVGTTAELVIMILKSKNENKR